jgi:hypothetical protein
MQSKAVAWKTLFYKIEWNLGWGVAQVVERLSSKREAQSSNPIPKKKVNRMLKKK